MIKTDTKRVYKTGLVNRNLDRNDLILTYPTDNRCQKHMVNKYMLIKFLNIFYSLLY